ncbi:hypothetical protein FGO68_gene3246 [Halteria grandinella]|uniref:Uncharacterized protein n=1 Tax=Halteria grandinella TaxID=5974 RepID=A0A8J8P7G3_HALGN|nr:hypothetical protein FGO68_gene3246 [Halteria grandinella]
MDGFKNGKQGDVLKVDAVQMLKTTNKEMKTLLHNLNKVVKTGEDYHKLLEEHLPLNIEVLDGGITVNLKVDLRSRNPPCTIHFNYHAFFKKQTTLNESANRTNSKSFEGDLFVYVSKVCKDPSEENNSGKHINQSCLLKSNLMKQLKKFQLKI